jgi:hypothetical protein
MDRPVSPREYLTPLERHAAVAHELFVEYRAAGFTEKQALRLVAYISRETNS